MILFRMVKYHKREYPPHIPVNMKELAGHFDVSDIYSDMPYSLHTEYSYGKRVFKNRHLVNFNSIPAANKDGVPMLWHSEQWADDFANYIVEITKTISPPSIIEIHPPFSNYCDILGLINRYKRFEKIILSHYPSTRIFIENRYGSLYKGGSFIFSTIQSLIDLFDAIKRNNLKLEITLDIPQLLAVHSDFTRKAKQFAEIFEGITVIRSLISGIHLWGKRISLNSKRPVAHCGDLNSFFENDYQKKRDFLNYFSSTFNDDQERFLVLEVNSSNDDIISIITDLESIGTKFV